MDDRLSNKDGSPHLLFAAATQPGMAQRVASGGLWVVASQGLRLATSLVVIPYLIRKLGSEQYGLLTLVNVVIAYMACTDLGMGLASTKFATEALARRDERAEAAAIWTSLVITSIPVLLSTAILFFAAKPLLVSVFRLPIQQQESAALAVRLGILTIWAIVFNSTINTPQLTRIRVRLNSTIELSAALLQSCVVLAVLGLGGKLIGVVAAGAFASLIATIVHATASLRLCPSLLRPQLNRSLIKPLLKFGAGAMAVIILGAVVGQGEKFLLVRWGSTRDLAYYNIAMTIAGLLVLVLAALAQPLMPSFVHLLSSSQKERLERLYNNILAGAVISLIPFALIICVSAKPFLDLWAGLEFGRASVLPLYILVGGSILKAVSVVPGTLLMALGRIDLMPRYQAVELIPYCLVMFLLVSRFGITGAAIAWSIRAAVESMLMFLAVARITPVRQRIFPQRLGDFVFALGVLIIPALSIWILLPIQSIVFLVTILALVGYGAIVFNRIATLEERVWLVDLVKKFWR